MDSDVTRGKPFPLGATVMQSGVNFSVYSKSSTAIELLLFEAADDRRPSRVLRLDPRTNRTYHYWHVFVDGIRPGQIYGYRSLGPFDLQKGLRHDPDKVLLDPYGKCVAVPGQYSRLAATLAGDNTASALKSVVVELRGYDWEGDTHPRHPFTRTVIYEMHVAGFTKHPSSGVAPEKRGTFAGLIEKIPYLQDLGVTAVELLPVFLFDEQDCPQGLKNYWGYSPVSFFAPHCGYSSLREPLGPIHEFRDMVKAFHQAGIEVILDVVFNHTAEGNDLGPTLCFKGLQNDAYYILEAEGAAYADYSGTGNTLNANHPVVRRMIIDSLRYWVQEMHVDGFRFDLASILSRDKTGCPLKDPPVLWDIETDPVLAGTKLIAEAWDAAGLYQVGSFIGDSWKEWNGRFRDDVRSFFRGDKGSVSKLPRRFLASPDLYGHKEREPEQSINFVTCHDGFTLNDLVSYDRKRNEANGEDSRDGRDDNLSWNCGIEGPTKDPEIEHLRNRQVKNFLAMTLLALGTPMILMGDEARRTQNGNNNAYCQDNEISWFDWTLVERHGDVRRFAKKLIHYRLHCSLTEEEADVTLNELLHEARIQWHGVMLNQPDWADHSHSLAFTFWSMSRRFQFHVILNAYQERLHFDLPHAAEDSQGSWRRWIDTFLRAPEDICDWQEAPAVEGRTYLVQPRSVVVLFAMIPGAQDSVIPQSPPASRQ